MTDRLTEWLSDCVIEGYTTSLLKVLLMPVIEMNYLNFKNLKRKTKKCKWITLVLSKHMNIHHIF